MTMINIDDVVDDDDVWCHDNDEVLENKSTKNGL